MKRSVRAAFRTAALLPNVFLTAADAKPSRATCAGDDYTPHSVVMGLSPVKATFGVSSCDDTNGWSVEIEDLFVYTYDGAPSEVFSDSYYDNVDAGAHDAILTTYDADYNEDQQVLYQSFSLLRRVAWQPGTFNASPEPVKKGGTVTIKGQLKIADWVTDTYRNYVGHTVALLFKPSGGTTYGFVKYVKTNSTGYVVTTQKQNVTGTWRLRYGGNSIAAAAYSDGDTVAVS